MSQTVPLVVPDEVRNLRSSKAARQRQRRRQACLVARRAKTMTPGGRCSTANLSCLWFTSTCNDVYDEATGQCADLKLPNTCTCQGGTWVCDSNACIAPDPRCA